jgi:hypothetical protein
MRTSSASNYHSTQPKLDAYMSRVRFTASFNDTIKLDRIGNNGIAHSWTKRAAIFKKTRMRTLSGHNYQSTSVRDEYSLKFGLYYNQRREQPYVSKKILMRMSSDSNFHSTQMGQKTLRGCQPSQPRLARLARLYI